jgi:beta-lactamase class C
VEQRLFSALGMKSSYINIPEVKMADYAQGYTKEDTPIRMTTGVLSSETYGIRATAADMIRFVEANMNGIELDKKLQRAIRATHTAYFKAKHVRVLSDVLAGPDRRHDGHKGPPQPGA